MQLFSGLILCLAVIFCQSLRGNSIVPEWNETELRQLPGIRRILSKTGKGIADIRTEPGGDRIASIGVRLKETGVEVDSGKMTEAGIKKINFLLFTISDVAFSGNPYRLTLTVQGPKDANAYLYLEGRTPDGKHYYKGTPVVMTGQKQIVSLEHTLPSRLKELHLRFDLLSPGVWTISDASFSECRPKPKKNVKPELLLHLPFDGSPDSTGRKPLEAKNVEYLPGISGKAARFSKRAGTLLRYAVDGNLIPERGTISLWIKPEWKGPSGCSTDKSAWRTFLSMERPQNRHGSGAIKLWSWGNTLRGDTSDVKDSYQLAGELLRENIWQHVAFSWDESGSILYINGEKRLSLKDSFSPLKFNNTLPQYNREAAKLESFFIGGHGNEEQADALIDELRIYSAPLPDTAIRELAHEFQSCRLTLSQRYFTVDRLDRFTFQVENTTALPRSFSWTLSDSRGAVIVSGKTDRISPKGISKIRSLPENLTPGEYILSVSNQMDSFWILTPPPPDGTLKTTLIETIHPSPRLGEKRFTSVGDVQEGTLAERPYLEAGENRGDRFAVRLSLPDPDKLYFLEWDYPDNKKRTCDILAQSTRRNGSEYELQVGYCSGDEYANSDRMLTGRALYYPRDKDVTLIFMTARNGTPAAAGEIRVLQIDSPLPVAKVAEGAAPQRDVGIYYEDPAINFGFGISGDSMPAFETVIDRLSAYMKYSGQNLLAYPVVWYHGMIDDINNPRGHVKDFLEVILSKFDSAGLSFMGTMNQHNLPVPDDLVTEKAIIEGSLHDSPVAIYSDGKVNPGKWHGSPPNFNIFHPAVCREVLANVDRVLATGADHLSFKGIVLHLTRHSILWPGDISSGYNDYVIREFEANTGIRVPVDRRNPMRGKLYADWLLENAREAWIDWRCRKLAELYKELADRLRKRRPDLKLVINCMIPMAELDDPRYLDPDFVAIKNREAGLEPEYFAGVENIILEQTLCPADYRWRAEQKIPKNVLEHIRVIDTRKTFYDLLLNAKNPWLHMHDRYWESAIGSTQKTHWSDKTNRLTAPWLNEQTWRVTTLNPAGFHAMRHYVLPLRYTDLLGITKGGFLIGTYGMEEYLTPFAQAFRALPAKRFQDLALDSEFIRVRSLEDADQFWFYAVNTSDTPGTVTLSIAQCVDLLTGESRDGEFKLKLAPYEFRSFRAPAGNRLTAACP